MGTPPWRGREAGKFTFAVDAHALLAERAEQFRAWGMARGDVRRARARIVDMWSLEPGGWAPELMAIGREAEERGDLCRAVLAYGAAKFPCCCTPYKEAAYHAQRRVFYAGPGAVVRVSLVRVPYRGGRTTVRLHHYDGRAPGTLLVTGGVDTWSIELHRLAGVLARVVGIDVVTMDMPGTGLSEVPLAPDAAEIYRGVSAGLRPMHGKLGILGISFGGLWAARAALDDDVDYAVGLGGPAGLAPRSPAQLAELPNGMAGILGNAAGLRSLDEVADLDDLVDEFSLRGPMDAAAGATGPALLCVNGADDPYVPQLDTLGFREREGATVWLVPRAGHCGSGRLRHTMAAVIAWVRHTARPTAASAAGLRAATRLLGVAS